MVVTLVDILNELKMTPSRAHVGKGPRNERELLRYKAHVGDITQPAGGKWQWDEDDEQLPAIRAIMESYKDGERAPSGWKKLPEGQPPAGGGAPATAAAAVSDSESQKKRSASTRSKANERKKKPRKVKTEQPAEAPSSNTVEEEETHAVATNAASEPDFKK